MLPSSVENQVRLANEAHQKAYGTPPEVIPEGPVVNGEQLQEQQQPQQAEAPAQPVEDAAYWKSRFDVLEGKYRAEVPRYADDLRSMRQRIQELEQAPVAQTSAPKISEDLKEKYGEEFLQDILKIIPQSSEAQQLSKKVEDLERSNYESGQERFFADLDKSASNWRQLNSDDGFLAWLAGVDDFSGMPRKVLFDEAVSRLNTERVSKFFNSYAGSGNSQSWDSGTQQRNAQLESQLAPNTNRATQAPPGKKFWTTPEIAQFYDDKRQGKLSDAEFLRIEQDIFAAQRENRIG